MSRTEPDPVSFVVLAKDTTVAKSRLTRDRVVAARVALELADATITTALHCGAARAVFVVTSDPVIARHASTSGATVVPEGRPVGVNAAAALGRRRALATHRSSPVAILVADLPRLTIGDLESVVAEHVDVGGPVYVADHLGSGTTCLVHDARRPGLAFGPDSARLHRDLGYTAAQRPLSGLRLDLDTPEDIEIVRGSLVTF